MPVGNRDADSAWLRFELWAGVGVHNSLTDHIFREAARVEPLSNADQRWRNWWATTSRAPRLDIGIAVLWPDKHPSAEQFLPQRVAHGRNQHFVRRHLDAGRAAALPKEQRLAELRLAPPPSELPGDVEPQGGSIDFDRYRKD